MLRTTTEEHFGKDPQKQGSSPILFSKNERFLQELTRSRTERWIAAWYYLRNRYPDEVFHKDPVLGQELKNLGETVLLWLPRHADKHIEKLKEDIVDFIDKLDLTGASERQD